MPTGMTFGDHKTYRLRKYYETWIEHTLLTASNIVSNPCDRLRVLHFMENLKAPAIEDPGRVPCGDLQKIGKMSRFPDKIACLLVMIRHLIMTWWEYNENNPGHIELLLVKLDELLDGYQDAEVTGEPETGYRIGIFT